MSFPPYPFGPPRGMMPGMPPGMPGMPPGGPGMPPMPGMPPGMPGMPGPMGYAPHMYPMGMPSAPGMPPAPRLGPLRPMLRPPQLGMYPPQARPPQALTPPPVAAPLTKKTNIYVGKIAATVNDDFMQQLLRACGPVQSWKRMEDPETKQPKGFGFCEFEDAEGVLRAVRLLNNLKVDGQELLVKADTATQKYIEQYELQKSKEREKAAVKAALEKEAGEVTEPPPSDEAEDNKVLEQVMSLLTDREEKMPKKTDAQRASELLMSLTDGQKLPPPPALPDNFRKAAKPEDDEREKERQLERELKRTRERERGEEEFKRKEADKVFEQKLKAWERYERDAAHLREKERLKQREVEKERIKLIREELENSDTDDEVEPWRRPPYRTSRRADERRKRRQRELEEDAIDRRREEEELAAKRARIEAEGIAALEDVKMEEEPQESGYRPSQSPQPSSQAAKEEEMEPEIDPNDPIYQAMMAAATAPQFKAPVKPEPVPEPSPEFYSKPESPPMPAAAPAPRVGVKRSNPNLMAMFGEDDEEEKRRKKLVPLQYTEEEMRAVHVSSAEPEDPQAQLRRMADSIPTTRDAVFSYKVKWDAYEPTVMGARVSRWVSNNITKLLGMEEPTLSEYVMKMLSEHTSPSKLYDEMAQVLEPKEAESFAMKLFRMIIYETEKSALGL